jgi:hypothetical protein
LESDDRNKGEPGYHLEGGLPVFDRLGGIEREQAEAKQRDRKYKDDQLSVNRRMAIFTGVLVLCTAAGIAVNGWQAHVSGISASAASDSASTAKSTLDEIKKGATDTHDLAEAAKRQADQTLAQATATNRLATESAKQVIIAQHTFDAIYRPYVGAWGENAIKNDKAKTLTISFDVKNFGLVPATEFIISSGAKIDGVVQRPDKPSVQAPGTLFPSDYRTTGIVEIKNSREGELFDEITTGRKTIEIEIIASYMGPGQKHYTYCTVQRYLSQLNSFAEIKSSGCTIKLDYVNP